MTPCKQVSSLYHFPQCGCEWGALFNLLSCRYLGTPKHRLKGADYFEFLDEVMDALAQTFPNAMVTLRHAPLTFFF